MTEKKNGNYEKPESHGEDDELEGVSGGDGGASEPNINCCEGQKTAFGCGIGHYPHDQIKCKLGNRYVKTA